MTYDSLYGFRHRAHQYLGRAHDATFELIDAVLTTRHVYSFAELSQSPLFRRQWSSVYEALQDSRPQRQRLMRLYLEHKCRTRAQSCWPGTIPDGRGLMRNGYGNAPMSTRPTVAGVGERWASVKGIARWPGFLRARGVGCKIASTSAGDSRQLRQVNRMNFGT